VDLDRAVEDVHDHVAATTLDHRDLPGGPPASRCVHLQAAIIVQQAGLVDLHALLGDEVLE